jgi:hypothetical protein
MGKSAVPMEQPLKVRESVAEVRRSIVMNHYGAFDQNSYVVTRGKQSIKIHTGINIKCSPTYCSNLASLPTKLNIIANRVIKLFQYLPHPLMSYFPGLTQHVVSTPLHLKVCGGCEKAASQIN